MNRYTNLWDNNSWIKYGEWLAEPKNPKIFEAKEKIVVRQTGDSIIATIIEKGIIARDNLHIIISNNISHKFILGMLNSRLTDFYYQQINPERGEALAQVKKAHVEQLPIPQKASHMHQSEIISLVDLLLQLNKDKQAATLPNNIEIIENRIARAEDKINGIVYKLYNLTEKEIKLIEGR